MITNDLINFFFVLKHGNTKNKGNSMKFRGLALGASLLTFALTTSVSAAERGSDGQLKLLFWQAVSTLNPYLSGGQKEVFASSLMLEPLARYTEKGDLVPWLVTEIPSIANGGIAKDLLSVTWKIKPGLKWSDGTDFSASDVVFTWKYCTTPDGGCAQRAQFDGIKSVDAINPLTVKVSFTTPQAYPFGAFVGARSPIIQQAQFAKCLGKNAPGCTTANFGPIGTGPFIVSDFKPNDVITFAANPNYRDPQKPAFASVILKGGGDPASAARAVFETGEYDYAYNMQIEPEILQSMGSGGKGVAVRSFGNTVERIHVNMYDPRPSLVEKRSTKAGGPHPALSDPAVRRALSLAIDRDILVEAGYGEAAQATCNIIPAPEILNSHKNDAWCLKQDIAAANKLLDDAGWKRGSDSIRAKNGVRLSFLFSTSTNSVRQAAQELIKSMWSEVGVETELRNVSAAVFFGGDPGSPDTYQKFYSDLEMFALDYNGTDPEKYLSMWTCSKIPSPENGWQGQNISRYCNADYDELIAELPTAIDPAQRAALIKEASDKLTEDGANIPLVFRGDVSAQAVSLQGLRMNSYDSQLWNIADWTRKH
jgi:peptide/nickel transport system substrate-binding protein